MQLSASQSGIRGDNALLLTPLQINRLDKAQAEGRRVQIRMSARQVAKNVSYAAGFITTLVPLLARALPLAARSLPTIMSGLATGLLSGGVHKAISGNGINAIEYRNRKAMNDLYLAQHPPFVEGDGLFLKHCNDISDDARLLMGKNSLFKNIPIVGWLL